MLSIKDAFLRVFKAESGTGYDFEIPGEEIESVTLSRRINRRKDEGTIIIHNDEGDYSSGEKQIQVGDRVDVFVSPQQSPIGWGEQNSGWGYGGWGGYRRIWSAWIQTPTYIREGPSTSALKLKGTDYVFGILSNRITFDAYDNRTIAGTSDAILNTVVGRECPELDLSLVEDPGDTTSIVADGTNVLEFVITLARRADCLLLGFQDKLVFKPIGNVAAEFTVDPSTDIGNPAHEYSGGSVTNVVRVDGGTDHAVDDQQTTQDGYTTVTDSSRATFQVSTRKSQLERVELWTSPTGSQESISVRIQKDDGGSPVAPGDQQSDVDSKQLSHHFLADDDYTSFLLNDHTLPEPNPWILVETDGPDGQDIGIDTSTGTPAYRAHYPFPISVQVRDGESIKQHTRIEERLKQKNLHTLDAAKEMSEEALGHHKDPESEVKFPAISRRTHRLDPGEVVTFDMARERLEGDYLVTESEETFDGNTYHASLAAQEVSSL